MQLRRLAAERRDRDRVLEQPARVTVVLRARRQSPQGAPRLRVEHLRRGWAQTGMRELAYEELEEALELVRIALRARCQVAWIGLRRRLERPHIELKPVAEALDSSKHAYGVPLGEAPVEQLDVAPHPRLDAPARVDELEREVRRSRPGPEPPLTSHCIHTLDRAVLG